MKAIRSTKISLKFSTKKKLNDIAMLCDEYARVVNFYIGVFKDSVPKKNDVSKLIVDKPQTEIENGTWLGYTLRQIAAREAISMLNGMSRKKKSAKVGLPIHKGKSIPLTVCCASIQQSKTNKFDLWLHLHSLGRKLIIDIPIKSHRHLKQLQSYSALNKSIILKRDCIVVSVDIETGTKKEDGETIGVDSGFAKGGALATLNDGRMFGKDIHKIIDKIQRKKQGSNKQKTARKHLKHYMDKVAKEIVSLNPKMIVVENLRGLNKNTKVKRRLTRNIRRRIGIWTYRHWLDRLQSNCELNRVQFRSVNPYNTSVTCPSCNHADRENRASRDLFLCLGCGYTEHADIVGARNILARGLSGEEFWKLQKTDRNPLTKTDLTCLGVSNV